ncbi:unnamed protein product [Cuscuta europaea]|uniref:Retrotransposon Copia-like N-terminal domain-containing protein n=1 Tax=Cuscuta europaea TaxID=41803 RepID=A0A9P0YHB8_CUSEU|nr:unnamed protein product [Cuscuta europaea]CAH9091613.1 unnamed protein product [Cuscuta europaea]
MAGDASSSEDEVDPANSLHSPTSEPPLNYNMESPYYLLSSDNPGVSLVGSPLTGLDNYSSWALAMTMALKGRNKFCFVDGSLPVPPSDHRDHARWQRINNMVMSWILHSVHSSLAPTVLYAPDASTVWSDFKDRYSTANGPRIYELERSIATLHQRDDSIPVYHNKLSGLWEELNLLDPPPQCTCSARTAYITQIERRRLMQFLMGLRDTYAPSRSQLLLNTTLPSVKRAYSLLLQDEAQRIHAPVMSSMEHAAFNTTVPGSLPGLLPLPSSSQPAAYIAHQNGGPKQFVTGSSKHKCSHCGLLGHTQQVCYRLHGYPPGHKFYRKGNSHGSSNPAATVGNDPIQKLLRLLQDSKEPKANMIGPFDEEGDWSGP